MSESATKASKTTEPDNSHLSRVHRFMVGDRVALNHDGVDDETLNTNEEGTVTGFDNDEQTYLNVEFDNGTTRVLTEDELRHLPPVS